MSGVQHTVDADPQPLRALPTRFVGKWQICTVAPDPEAFSVRQWHLSAYHVCGTAARPGRACFTPAVIASALCSNGTCNRLRAVSTWRAISMAITPRLILKPAPGRSRTISYPIARGPGRGRGHPIPHLLISSIASVITITGYKIYSLPPPASLSTPTTKSGRTRKFLR